MDKRNGLRITTEAREQNVTNTSVQTQKGPREKHCTNLVFARRSAQNIKTHACKIAKGAEVQALHKLDVCEAKDT